MKHYLCSFTAALAAAAMLPVAATASSHMDAPLITLDPAANTTDVYAFVAKNDNGDTNTSTTDTNFLVVGLGVYPFEEPGIGPNAYNFDPNVLYQIHICTTNKARGLPKAALNDVEAGRPTISYQFKFTTTYADSGTILISYLGIVSNVFDANQNLRQTYTVTKVDHRKNNKSTVIIQDAMVPPNNEGDATPLYNQGNVGDNPAKAGVADPHVLDLYTREAIFTNDDGYLSFAGQRDDGFYADVLSIFDILQLRPTAAKDSQKGFNIHEMVLRIPISELGSDMQVVGVYATTSRRAISVLRNGASYSGPALARLDEGTHNPFGPAPTGTPTIDEGGWVQVARQGNPLFNEVLVAVADKDLYSRTLPTVDTNVFLKYALNPEVAAAVYGTNNPATQSGRTDLASIFIPDLIKVDLSTGPVNLQGGGEGFNDNGYNSLGVFGGDTVKSKLTGMTISSGWPNGRRYGDNVVDIALNAILDSTNLNGAGFGLIGPPTFTQGVLTNDAIYNKVFPYESTPQNGRNHLHDSP